MKERLRSARIVRHRSLTGLSALDKCRRIPEIVGTFKPTEWTDKNQLVVDSILADVESQGLSAKGESATFFKLLINKSSTYKKFCFFGRSPRMLNRFKDHVSLMRARSFCVVCDANLASPKLRVCVLCSADRPTEAKRAACRIFH